LTAEDTSACGVATSRFVTEIPARFEAFICFTRFAVECATLGDW
jgi:hypothetical protein